ncbi:MAG: rhodanese-like domain-containing protein [Lutimonas sp.]
MKRTVNALLLIFFIGLLSVSCGKGSKDDSSLVTPQELSLKQKDVVLIDVRTPREFEQGHLENSVNINIADKSFKEEVEKLDRSQPVYVYCKVGGRSAKAAGILKEMGFEEVYDLEGGIRNWERSGMKVVK